MIPIHLDHIPGSHPVLYVGDGAKDMPGLAFPEGTVLVRWALSEEEIRSLVTNGAVDLWIWSYGKPIQPVLLQVAGHPYPEEEAM